MPKNQKNTFLLVANEDDQLNWLQDILVNEGSVVNADANATEQTGQLIDMTGAQIMFVALNNANLRKRSIFIEDLLTLRPRLLVVAVADKADNELLLNVMRAGAREFITSGTATSEVMRLVQRLRNRAPVIQGSGNKRGKVMSLISARPGSDSPMLALHLALAIQQSENHKVLLLDLGTPAADTLTYLGLTAPYTFFDAIHSLRRLDATLIDSAFAKHESGLKLLSLAEENMSIGELTSTDIYLLLGVLQHHFSHIVINLGGVPYSDFLQLMISHSDMSVLLLEQSVPSCKQNMNLVRKLSQSQMDMNKIHLVIDRYLPSMPPEAINLSQGMNINLLTTLPPSGMARLKMMNSGESLFDCAPRDPYTLAVKKMAKSLTFSTQEIEPAKSSFSWLRRWFSSVDKPGKVSV